MKYKRILSVFLIALFITFQIGNIKNEVKANPLLLTSVASAAPPVAIALALLYAADVQFNISGKAYTMAHDLVNQLGEDTFTAGDALVITPIVLSTLQSIINKYKDTPVQDVNIHTISNDGSVEGQLQLYSDMPKTFGDKYFYNTSAGSVYTITSVYTNLSNSSKEPIVLSTDITVPVGAVSFSLMSFSFGSTSGSYYRQTMEITFYDSLGNAIPGTQFNYTPLTNSTVGWSKTDLISYSYNLGVPIEGYSDRSISLDYTGDLDNADVGKAQVAFPYSTTLTANPSMTWDNPLSLEYAPPISTGLVTTIPIDTPIDTPVDTPVDTSIPTDWSVPVDSAPSFNFAPLQLSLQSKFPFCIPFDFVNGIKNFVSTPVAPKFTVTIPSVYGMQEGSFDIDFGKFDKIVKILRFFILIAFLYNLLKITRDLIRG